jgi:hypothetical protein
VSVKPAGTAIATFVAATIVGFLAIAFGWIAYADSTNYFDREGSTGMAVVFMIAPMGGIACGAICAFLAYRFAQRRPR